MSKREIKQADIAVNCCQRSKHSPAGSNFSRTKHSNKELTALSEFISKEDYTTETICQAVWAVSDKAPLANISGSGEAKDDLLRKKVAEITGRYIPWYKVTAINKEFKDGHIETIQSTLYGEFECHMTKGTEYMVKLTDKKGKEIMVLSPLTKAHDDLQNYHVEFSVSQLPQKEFFITFYDAQGVTILQKPFDLRS